MASNQKPKALSEPKMPEPFATLQFDAAGRPLLGLRADVDMTPVYTADQLQAYAAGIRAEVLGEVVPAGWQRRYSNGEYVHPNGTLWSDWKAWDDEEWPERSGRWVNEYRQVYTLATLEAVGSTAAEQLKENPDE